MGHHHHHGHDQGVKVITPDLKNTYILAILITLLFIVFEAVMGLRHHALTLVSDAGHKLIDVFSLSLTLLTFWLSSSKARPGYTFGFRKLSVIISLFNAVLVVIVAFTIIWESIERLMESDAAAPDGAVISITAAIGFVVNCLVVFLLYRKRSHDVNTKGQFIHTLTDTLVYIGVAISGLIIKWTGFAFIDPLISLLIAIFVLYNIWGVLKESFRMSIDGVPAGVDMEALESSLRSVSGVEDIRELHVHAVSTIQNRLSATIFAHDTAPADLLEQLKAKTKECGIQDSTLEIVVAK